ncbi:MAG TPA: hypothetical protein VGG70_07045 [Candidatus Cybelea sp.]
MAVLIQNGHSKRLGTVRLLNFWEKSGGFDFAPLLLAIVLVFAVLGSFQFLRNLPSGESGLLRFERACPIYRTAPHQSQGHFQSSTSASARSFRPLAGGVVVEQLNALVS